tara:strand:- start:8112 stop:8444 length:333 start_codon:yes stop_codon:yes gene_type:complete
MEQKTVKLNIEYPMYVRVWESGHVRLPGEKPVFGEITKLGFRKYLDIKVDSVDKNGNGKITLTKAVDPVNMTNNTLVTPMIDKTYKNQINLIRGWIHADKKLQAKIKKQI